MSYLSEVSRILQEIDSSQSPAIDQISEKLSKVIRTGGIIHTFGCGHSSLLAQDVYYRAGGLVPIHPILIEELMLHRGAWEATVNERKHDFVQAYLEKEDMRPQDAIVIISTSGRNPTPIDTAVYSKRQGLYTIALTSLDYRNCQPSRHISKWRLEDHVDDVIDMKVPVGDTIMLNGELSYSPVSSVAGTGILHALMTRVIENLKETEVAPAVFKSGNVDGSDQYNRSMIERYKRISF